MPSKQAYAKAGVQLDDLIKDEAWLSLATFAPSRLFKDHFQSLAAGREDSASPWKDVSVDLHLNTTGEAHFVIKNAAGKRQWEKAFAVLAETSIYRSTPKELRRHTTSFEVTSRAAQPASRNYDGYELRWKILTFRPALFKFEGIMFGVLGTYILLYLIGRYFSNSRARSA